MNKISYDKHIVMKSINIHKLVFTTNLIGFLTITRKRQQLIRYIEELYVPLSTEILKHWKFHFYIRSRNVVPCQMKQNTSDNLLQSVSK